MVNEISQRSAKPVAIWLLIGVGMIIIQILLGGITRLTGSGLSITEWNVVTGTLPPLNEHQWLNEFAKYKQTPQYNLLNFDFTIKDFKFIFFWEWFHRFWARLIGVVFLVPFIIFLYQKRFKPFMVKPMLILFLLGALQGAVGWIMVASGLTGDAVYVKPTRLALHFLFALGLLCYTFWFALSLLVADKDIVRVSRSTRKLSTWIIGILVIQLLFGALMAGHKAATAAPTWPDINGEIIPSYMFRNNIFTDLLENKITIHFIHRGIAYLLVILIAILTIKMFKVKGSVIFNKTKWIPLLLVLLQLLLGIFSVLYSLKIVPNQWGPFEWMAQLHQLGAMFLLLSFVWLRYITRNTRISAIS
ncbi:MAG: COX15/CtaA family protein [Chitinophagaceae bacterium]|nr:COX15/CtaA family protein [Chitinophagaceae bacterium]MCB9055214.1 COX15/CtaA family protein [Chitinophagales bacterium]